jgi:hypothetical protein
MNTPKDALDSPDYDQQLWDSIFLKALDSMLECAPIMDADRQTDEAATFADEAMARRQKGIREQYERASGL